MKTEAQKAKAWRQRSGYTLEEVAALTGFSYGSVRTFEAGRQNNGMPVTPEAMRRYRLACAAVQYGHHTRFDWND